MKSALLFTALLCVPAAASFAQDAPPPPKAAPSPSPGKDRGKPMMKREVHIMDRHEGGPGLDAGMLPPGTWWKNADIKQKIALTDEQQKRIEDIFLQSRVQLIHAHAALEEQELMLEPLISANPIDQGKALAQINKIADTRAELEKTNAKMLLGIRGVLSADQWTKLQASRHMHMRGPGNGMFMRDRDGGPGGPDVHIRHRTEGPMPGPGAE